MPSQLLHSSFIKSVSHKADALTVEFKDKGNTRFRYHNVPMMEYLKMITSPLPGKYYTENIKGKYLAKKLTPNQA